MKTLSRVLAILMAVLLGGCGTNSSGGGGGGGGTDTGRQVDGFAFIPLRAGAARAAAVPNMTPLAGLTVRVFAANGGAILAAGTTDARGHFLFSDANGNPVPADRTLRIVATGSGHTLSCFINTDAQVQTVALTEATHVGTLALASQGQSSYSDANIALYQIAARSAIDAAVVAQPTADFTLDSQATAAATVAGSARTLVTNHTVAANHAPVLSNVLFAPTQFDSNGGSLRIDADVSDADSDPATVTAMVYTQAGAAPTRLNLTVASGHAAGNITIPANTTAATAQYAVALIADDGVNPAQPNIVRTISVFPQGTFTLDILAETLFDEPASRAVNLDTVLAKMRPRVVSAGAPRRAGRQVNANQSIRGVDVTVNDATGVSGKTDNSGLLLLNVPLTAMADGVVELTGSISGRVTYHQFLVLPAGLTIHAGDRIEVNLVLSPETSWLQLATQVGLGTVNFNKVPLLAFFDVTNGVTLSNVTPGSTRFRANTSTVRTDDGDFFAATLPVGVATASGTFINSSLATGTWPFGPLSLNLRQGEIGAVSVLVPPGN